MVAYAVGKTLAAVISVSSNVILCDEHYKYSGIDDDGPTTMIFLHLTASVASILSTV